MSVDAGSLGLLHADLPIRIPKVCEERVSCAEIAKVGFAKNTWHFARFTQF